MRTRMDVTLPISHHTKSVGGGGQGKTTGEPKKNVGGSSGGRTEQQTEDGDPLVCWFTTGGGYGRGWGVRGRDRGREGFKRIG